MLLTRNYNSHFVNFLATIKSYCWFLCLIFVFYSASAQIPLGREQYADSLIKRLKKELPDTAKAKISFLLSEFYLKKDTVKTNYYLKKGLSFSNGSPFLKAVSLYYKALTIEKNKPKLAEKIYIQAETALVPFKISEAYLIRSMCWYNHASILRMNNDPKAAIEILLNKAIPLALQSGNKAFLGRNYYHLALGFKNLQEHAKAEMYLKKTISTLKPVNTPQYLAMAYQSLSENYTLLGKVKQAKAYLDSMKVLLKPYPKNEMWLDYYAGEALRLTVALQFDSSLAVISRGVLLAENLKEEYAKDRLLHQKFYALYHKNEKLQAIKVALDLTQHKKFMAFQINKSQIYYGLALTYEEVKDMPNAHKWLKKYSELSDSLNSSKLKETVNSLEIKYRTAENQKQIVLLNAKNEKVSLDAKNNRLTSWLLGVTCIFLFILAILGWFFYRNSKKLTLQKDLNHQQELKDIDRQQQLKLVQVMLNAKEDEQNRVARDLHDGLGGMLAVSKINLAHYAQENKNTDADLHNVITQLGNSMGELRRIAHNMMPEMLLKLGLEASLRDLCETVASEKLKVTFHYLGISNNLKAQEQINIYRIVQEAIANATKHSDAQNLLLQCSQNENIFFITIEDDGKGFDTNHIDNFEGIGLSNIKSRVEYLKGKIEILSGENKKGTSINIELYVTT
jgi:signal transduction histidine kinase